MHNVEQSLLPRIPNQDEAGVVQSIGIVGAELIVERRRRFLERDAMLLEIRRGLSPVPDEAHAT
jgi:hypothetical protein